MLYMKYIIISSEIKLGALSPMQHLCSYRVKKVAYTQFLGGENSTKHGRAGAIIVCCTAVVFVHCMTHNPVIMKDLQEWVLPSGGIISCNSPLRGFRLCQWILC
jgi:hypothetical protein